MISRYYCNIIYTYKGFLSHTEYNSCSLSNELTFLKAHRNQVPFIIIPLFPS